MDFFHEYGGDPLKPSLFELVAQEQLRDLLQPALKYVLSVFAQRHPRYLLRIVNKHEEFYALIMLYVERHYLRKYNASFSENFYGLKRRRKPLIETERARAAVGGVPVEEKLRDREVWRSLVVLIGLPYLRAKAQDYYEDLGGGSDLLDDGARQVQALTEEGFRGRLRRLYKWTYPRINLAFEGWLMAYNVAYAFERTPFYRPWLSWVGVDLRRLGIEDLRAAAAMGDKVKPQEKNGRLTSVLRRLLLTSPRLLLDSLKLLLPTAIFFIKFLEWWYSPSSPARVLSTSPLGPAIPPPRLLPPHPKGIPVDPTKFGHCPLCQSTISNATALPSGYVFCYRCAFSHVEKHGTCPVTLLPVHTWDLRKEMVAPSKRCIAFFGAPLFGKQLQAEVIPGWSEYYLDYKFLKKIISSLVAKRPASEAAALALGIRPGHSTSSPPVSGAHAAVDIASRINEPSLIPSGQDDDRGPDFQAHKAAFFFKLERELEKINAFYLRKEAELKLRLETLLSKRRASALRAPPDSLYDTTQNSVEWKAVEEGFHLLERDLSKLQINATGFRKILKKWDKRSRSTTKELYLARQVDIQPVFDRQLISELSDTVAACLVDITDVSSGLELEGAAVSDLILNRQISNEGSTQMGLFRDLESNLRKAVLGGDQASVRSLVVYSDTLGQQHWGKGNITRILWRAVVDAPPPLADLILATSTAFDYQFVDDINGRTCLHEAAVSGALRLVDLCLSHDVKPDVVDVYGRSAFHYAAMHGHVDVCRRLLQVKVSPYVRDMENYSPLVYATLKGSVDCVRVLLEEGGVPAQPTPPDGDLLPLALASLAGHLDVVLLLLEHGALSLPSSNGEYPIHFAARQGHADISRILVRYDGWDVPDKYNEWTPIFHAARFGHEACVRVLLEAGSRTDVTDEHGNNALHYAAWYGHQECVSLLLESVRPRIIRLDPARSPSERSTGSTALRAIESEIDHIPSLSLPPPMMPHRVYGHNYLDKQCLIQVTIGNTASRFSNSATPAHQSASSVRLHPRFMNSASVDASRLSSPLLKLVMTSSPSAASAPHTIPLSLSDEVHVLTLQTPSLDQLSLEFSLYPNFGTKTIGRAVALPSMLASAHLTRVFTLPILDHRLHVIGEVSFEINIITPFEGVTLEIGGAVETYWKSLAVPHTAPAAAKAATPRLSRARQLGSAQLSPTGSPITVSPHAQPITISSITGSYVYLTVQVTQDLQPVVFGEWCLPQQDFDLWVADVTLAQFEALARRKGRELRTGGGGTSNTNSMTPSTLSEWHSLIRRSMVSLENLLKIVPASMGLCLELAYPITNSSSSSSRDSALFRHRLPLNSFVDSILRTVYHASAPPPEGHGVRRQIIFTSSSPDACATVNWKQPNYPVLFASSCGEIGANPPSTTIATSRNEAAHDLRLSSIGAAVEFSKNNNLLGVLLDTYLLVKVPSLVRAVRGAGLLISAYGIAENLANLVSTTQNIDGGAVDAVFQEGVLVFHDHFPRAWF
ncbi:cyclin-dependent protein kinase inhibitor [Lactarius vividus]|nr:cyclin-dependent protein kinase inhibitor [Lactarius vividus]